MKSLTLLFSDPVALSEFPSIHPLIVHFAISLIIFAALLQLVNAYFLKKELAWVVMGMLFFGFLAAQLASGRFHPHTTGLSEAVHEIEEQHEHWAEWTIYTAIAGLVSQLIYLYFVRYGKRLERNPFHGIHYTLRDRITVLVIAVIMLSSAFCVIQAGHYGARLVHIEGVGPQGRFLEEHH